MLRTAFYALKRDAAPGVDGLTWQTYEADLDGNITDLTFAGSSGNLSGTAQLPPLHTEGGRSTAADRICRLEDKVVQRATVVE